MKNSNHTNIPGEPHHIDRTLATPITPGPRPGDHMRAFERLVDAFAAYGITVHADREQQDVKCPAHEDNTASLSIRRSHDRALIDCKAGCPHESVLAAVGLRPADLFDTPHDRKLQPVVEYSYVDDDGIELFQQVRFDPKAFRVRHRNGSEWIWDMNGVRRVLYHLPEVLTGIQHGTDIIVVEGEKDADRLRCDGFVTTTSPMGAASWSKTETDVLHGANVVVIPDNDEPGHRYAETIAQDLTSNGSAVRIVSLPGLGESEDVSDWLNNGGSATALRSLIAHAPIWESVRTRPDTDDTPDRYFHDTANSTRLVQIHGDHIRYVAKWKKWIAWGAHAWTLDGGDVKVREMAKDVSSVLFRQAGDETNPDVARRISAGANRAASKAGISGMVDLARGIDGVMIRHDELDADPWLFGVQNGVIDLRTGEHREGEPADLMHRQSRISFDSSARCSLWEQCMVAWFPDEQTRRYVQRLAGSALVGKQKDHRFIIHYGQGANGKGTFVRAVAHIMGDYFITPDKSLIVRLPHEKHGTERAALFRTRLAVAVETDKRQKLDEAQIKNLTGGDRIDARRMYEDTWEFDPSHSMWLQTNYLPEIQGRDGGIWRRVRVVPWVATFDGDREDTDLDEKLERESSGILNWLIEGCLAWQRDGLDEPFEVLAATAEYRATEDILQRFADATGLTFQKGLEVSARDLGESIAEWCKDEGLSHTPSVGERADWLKGHGASSVRRTLEGKKRTVWRGVGFCQPSSNAS